MPTRPIAYVDQPLVMPRVTPDYSRLAALYQSGGAQLANLAMQRGQITSSTLDRLGALFSGYHQASDVEKRAAAALALRREEKAAEIGEKEKDRAERAAERTDAAKQRSEAEDRGAARYMVDHTLPGPMSKVAADLALRFPETAARFSPQTTLPATVTPGAMGTVSPTPTDTGQVVLHANPDDARAAEQAAAQQARWGAEDANRVKDNERADRALAATIENQKAMRAIAQQKANADTGDKTQLTPAGIDMAAMNYRKTGVMPPLGMGDKTTRQRIINRAAEMTPDDMVRIEAAGNDIAGNKQGYVADTDSLKTLQKSRDTIAAFEKTAKKNIDVFLDAAGKVVDTGSPLANTLVRNVTGKVLGSPNQAAYDAARQVAVNEIAKIVAGGGLNTVLSDSARQEISHFNPANATLAQTVATLRLLRKDMDNRANSLDEEIKAVKGRVKTKPADDESGGGGGGFIEAIDQNGAVHHAPAGTPLPAGWKLKQ